MRKLLDAAMVAFDRRGYHATRVNDIVELAKTSHGTFYLYFANKEDLLRALVLEASRDLRRLDDELSAHAGRPTWQALRQWIGEYSNLWRRYAPLLRSWTELSAEDPELGKLVRHTLRGVSSTLSACVEASGPPPGVEPGTAGVAMAAMLDHFHYLQDFLRTTVDDAALDTLTTLLHRSMSDTSNSGGAGEAVSAHSADGRKTRSRRPSTPEP
jgi:AcrR family transcriptional regulator